MSGMSPPPPGFCRLHMFGVAALSIFARKLCAFGNAAPVILFSSEAAGGTELEHHYVPVDIYLFGLWKEHNQIQDRVEVNDSASC